MLRSGIEKTQENVYKLLSTLINNRELPSAMLFSGQKYTGRMYTAISVAQALGSGLEETIIISDRDYTFRLQTGLRLFREKRNSASRAFLSEIITMFLSQFHGALLDSQSNSAKKKFSDAADCMDLISAINSIDEKQCESYADKIKKSLKPLIDLDNPPQQMKINSISVGQVRNIRQWVSTSSVQDKPKVVIIEGLENSLPAAVNALLKIIEEPPDNTYFIIISANEGRIPATILSRVRVFSFKMLGDAEKKYILGTIFVNPNEYKDLESFFVIYSGVDDNLFVECAKSIVYKEHYSINKLVKELERTQAWDRFFYHICSAIRQRFLAGEISERKCFALISEIDEIVNKGRLFMQMRRLTFDFVVYRIAEVL